MDDLPLAQDLALAIEERRTAFMFGAGISMFRNSGCPGWESMVVYLIDAIGESCIVSPSQYLKPHLGLLFNETFFQIMSQTLSEDQTAAAIKACLNAPHYSNIHSFAAWCANHFDTKLLTTNFDELIERSGLEEPENMILKLHGTLSNTKTLRFRANSVFEPLPEQLLRKVGSFIKDRILVVAGYGGMDFHDVMPALLEGNERPKRVLWFTHPTGARLNNKVVTQYIEPHGIQEFVIDVDDVFRQTLKILAQQSDDSGLRLAAEWEVKETCSDPDWWKVNANKWCDEIRKNQSHLLRLLWARIANHVRLYKVAINGETRNLADEAYESIKSINDPLLLFEAKIKGAYMGRLNGYSQNAADSLESIIQQLCEIIKQSANRSDILEYKRLLGEAQHQRGAALQFVGNDYKSADKQLTEAILTRKQFNSAELHYSKFQQYMNARLAFDKEIIVENHYQDLGWQERFADELELEAAKTRQQFRMREYGEILHNLGFVYQCMADDARRAGKPNDLLLKLAGESLDRYKLAASIREDTRDPRMIVQSLIRLGQINLFIASRQPYTSNSRWSQIQKSEDHLYQAIQAANDIERVSVDISKEELRLEHLASLRAGVQAFRLRHLPPWSLPWLPLGSISTTAQIDRESMAIRDDPERACHLAVVTAVIDKNNQVLMTKLGDYAKRRFGDHAWVLPGGSVEDGEQPSQAAVREIHEETGLAIDSNQLQPIAWIGRPNHRPHHLDHVGELLLLFGVKLEDNRPVVSSSPPESIDSNWIALKLNDLKSQKLSAQYKGIFPLHHAYWARLAQFELGVEGSTPRFLFYHDDDMSLEPWLSIENGVYKRESNFAKELK